MAENLLLDVMPEEEHRRIEPFCESVRLESRMTLVEPDTPIDHVWFPRSGVCSTLIHVDNGESVEVGLVGREGMAGLPLVLGDFANPFHVLVQIPGDAVRISREAFTKEVMESGRPFCSALLKYANLFLATVAQTAACNRLHHIDQRLARWLLDMRARADSDRLPVTHEFLGLIVGAYRPSVSNTLKGFEDRGIVRVGRGNITLLDQAALEREACECHAAIQTRTAHTLERIRSMAVA
jgi:CRP-like cAMP-binding protein